MHSAFLFHATPLLIGSMDDFLGEGGDSLVLRQPTLGGASHKTYFPSQRAHQRDRALVSAVTVLQTHQSI